MDVVFSSESGGSCLLTKLFKADMVPNRGRRRRRPKSMVNQKTHELVVGGGVVVVSL